MKIISYEQIWAVDLWLDTSVGPNGDNVVAQIFNHVEQVQWLLQNDFVPVITKHYDIATQNIKFIYQFTIPDEVQTFLTLKWTSGVERIDFDNMVTVLEKQIV